MRYRLIALDLDGTLLNPEGQVSAANRAAIARAQAAGAIVVPCTGRSWRESRGVLAEVPGLELGVFITGALVTEMSTGRSIDLAEMEPHLVHELIQVLGREPEAVLVYREFEQAGHDYLVTGQGELTANTRWWFDVTGAQVHENRVPTVDQLHYSVRVGMVVSGRRLAPLIELLKDRFSDRIYQHAFGALPSPDPDESLHVLEAFGAGVDKWRGLRFLADHYGIPHGQIAAIGDQVNDLAMLRGAGCSVAMANGVAEAKAAARHLTASNAEDGVAQAIDRMLAGAW